MRPVGSDALPNVDGSTCTPPAMLRCLMRLRINSFLAFLWSKADKLTHTPRTRDLGRGASQRTHFTVCFSPVPVTQITTSPMYPVPSKRSSTSFAGNKSAISTKPAEVCNRSAYLLNRGKVMQKLNPGVTLDRCGPDMWHFTFLCQEPPAALRPGPLASAWTLSTVSPHNPDA